VVKNLPVSAGDMGLIPGLGRSPGEGNGNPSSVFFFFFFSSVFLPGKSHGQRSLVGYSPWNHKRTGHNIATTQQQSRS